MKKVWQIISVVLVIVLALGMTAFAEDGTKAKFIVGSSTVEYSEDDAVVELPITFEGNTKLNTLQLEVSYDKGIKCVEYIAGDVIADITEPAVNRNPVVMPFASAVSIEVKSGTFATLKFSVPADKAKEYAVNLKIVEAYDDEKEGDPNIISEFEVVNGKITVLENPEMAEAETAREKRKQDVIALKINASSAYAYGKTTAIDPDNSKVVPYLKNNRTLVPLRFVSETLGADVQWEDGWDYCYVIKGDKKIKITFNSANIEVNGEVVTYDAPVEVVQDRTMVPIRFISEQLGYDVKWNQANQLVIITPADNPWIEDGQAEEDVLEGILVTFLFNGIF